MRVIEQAEGIGEFFFGAAATPYWTNASTLVTIAAVVSAGIWSWFRFDLGRDNKPRCNLEVSVRDTPSLAEGTMLEVEVSATNVGSRLVELENIRVEVFRLRPLDQAELEGLFGTRRIEETGPSGDDPSPLGNPVTGPLGWPPAARLNAKVDAHIEPGETDRFTIDVHAEDSLEEVRVYVHAANRLFRHKPIGWTRTARHVVGGERKPIAPKGGPHV